MKATSLLLLLVAATVACGSRTALDPPVPDALESHAVVSFSACGDGTSDWLLFDFDTEDGERLYAIRANGTGGHRVTLPNPPSYYPSVSPDGSKLLYVSFNIDAGTVDGGDDSTLYIYDLATRTSSSLLTSYALSYAALSPDNETIAYTTSYSLRAIDADGTNDRLLFEGPDSNGSGFGHPTFAGDSQTILYGGGGMLGTIQADGTGNQVLLTEPSAFEYPNGAFSPDYQSVVAGVDCGETAPMTLSLYTYPAFPGGCAGGSVLADVTSSSAGNEANDPAWNPNGLIAYGSGSDVFVTRANGGAPTNATSRVTGRTGRASDPVWVPACAVLP